MARLSKFERLVLHNQTAIMWAIMFPKRAEATLRPRIEATTPLTLQPRKPHRRHPQPVREASGKGSGNW